LTGYAAVFDQETELFRDYFESIAPGAFKRSLSEGADVRALVNHNPDKVLGRTSSKPPTLTLAEDKKGLRSTIKPPDTETGREIVELIRRGDVSQMSFAFRPKAAEERMDDDGTFHVRITDADLFDVSAVTYPAYEQTSIKVRNRQTGELIEIKPEPTDKEAEAAREPLKREQNAETKKALAELNRLIGEDMGNDS